MPDKLKNILIGSFVLMSILLAVATVFFVQPSVGDGKKILNVRFSNLAGIHIGTKVTYGGKPIGTVEKIARVKKARKDKQDEFGRIYCYQLKLIVDSSVEIYDCDTIAIQTTGLMGEKSIGITPKSTSNNSVIITHDIIYADSVDSFQNTADQISQLSDKAEKAIDILHEWFQKNSDNLSVIFSSMSSLISEIDNRNLVDSAKESLDSFNSNMNKLDTTIENINELTSTLNKTTGTIGKIVNSDDVYLKCDAILSKATTLFNDINNYGLLFQYSKGWQRLRTKRANIMQSLDSPKDFQGFFEMEISEINTSLARLNQLMQKANSQKQKQKILNSTLYKKNFHLLYSRIESLLNTIKLYNQNLVDKSNNE